MGVDVIAVVDRIGVRIGAFRCHGMPVRRIRWTIHGSAGQIIAVDQQIAPRIISRALHIQTAWNQIVLIVSLVKAGPQSKLSEVGGAIGCAGALSRPVERRKQDRGQNRDDGNHYQKFYQSE
ncbi:hypothetical protein SDC9_133457 [bioreactor metagenome]|uniref:Uncharacterized protein n=1 Tax=bioreactor metagenome TaxID=1076179 RepID=A0A645DBB7_9ZZZZ